MGINLTSELVQIGLLELTEQTYINWRLALYEAIKSSDTEKAFTLINSAPKIIDNSILISMKNELSKIVPVNVLFERIEEFQNIEPYIKIKAIFEVLDSKGIKQFTRHGIDDDFPNLLDEYAGSDWRPNDLEQEDKVFFVLGECFSIYYK